MYRILSLNGGGIRGYLTLQILSYIEEQADCKISDLFDLVVGTSSGSLIGALLDSLPASYVSSTLKSSYRHQLFKPNLLSFGGLFQTKYKTENKNNLIEEITDHISFRNYDFAAVAYDIKSNRPVIFNTLEQENNYRYLMTTEYSTSDAVKASSAAPLFWDPYSLDEMILVDGAMVCNDPTNIGIKLALNTNHRLEDLYIVNLTTGSNTRNYDMTCGAGILQWTMPLLSMLTNSQANATSMLYTNEGLDYYSLDVPLINGSDDIDDISDDNLLALEKDAQDLIHKNKDLIHKIIKDLTRWKIF